MDADTQTTFVLQYAQGWLLYVAVAVVLILSYMAWRRYGPAPKGLSGKLARACRLVAIALIVFALCGPAWRSVITTAVPGRLLVLVDHSASMQREDGPNGAARIQSATALYQALADQPRLAGTTIEWRAIGGVSGPINPSQLQADKATGVNSSLANDIEQMSQSIPSDMVLVVSDFRSTEGSTLDVAAERLRRLGQSAWGLGVGGVELDAELFIEEVSGNSIVALGEEQPFVVRFAARSLASDTPITLRVRSNGEVIQSREIPAEALSSGDMRSLIEERLDLVLDTEGTQDLVFEVEQGDLRSELNRQVEVSTRRLNVLMLAHRPRWEMRYLQVALQRDHTVELHSYLADGRWRRWSSIGPTELPSSREEFAQYDVVIVGDIAPSSLPIRNQNALVGHIRENGAGLVWIPGDTGNTALFSNTELGALLPVELPGVTEFARSFEEDTTVAVDRLPAAVKSAFLDPGEQNWDQLPYQRRIAAIDKVRDLSRVWMVDKADRPVVVSAQFGSGTSVFIAIDETWRWRRNVGDVYLHRFHSQILRFASRARATGAQRWRIDAVPFRASPGQAMVLSILPTAVVTDPDRLPQTVTVVWRNDQGDERLQELEFVEGSEGYRAQLNAPAIGQWRIAMLDGLVPEQVAPGALTVTQPAAETRDPRFDATALENLTAGSGGRSFVDVAELVKAIPNLSREEQNGRLESVWDHWWWLFVIVFVLGVEWSLRRLSRLP